MKYKLSFYKDFKLVPPFCGLVSKVIKPKGTKKQEPDGKVSYNLHTDNPIIYHKAPMLLEPGLYWVLDICKVKESNHWNQYLFIIEPEGAVYPIGEWLNTSDSSWIIQAVKLVNRYFNGERLEKIELTKIDYKVVVKSGWKSNKQS